MYSRQETRSRNLREKGIFANENAKKHLESVQHRRNQKHNCGIDQTSSADRRFGCPSVCDGHKYRISVCANKTAPRTASACTAIPPTGAAHIQHSEQTAVPKFSVKAAAPVGAVLGVSMLDRSIRGLLCLLRASQDHKRLATFCKHQVKGNA